MKLREREFSSQQNRERSFLGTYVNENCVDVIGTVVALERGDVRPEVVSWKKNLNLRHVLNFLL